MQSDIVRGRALRAALGFAAVYACAFGCSRRPPSDDATRAPSSSVSGGQAETSSASPAPSASATIASTTPAGASLGAASATTGPTASGSSTGVAPDGTGMPEPTSVPALRKMCAAAPCTGPFDTVIVWRTPQGRVGAYEHRGDIRRCSHPPTGFYDRSGTEISAIPEKPVVPGSAEQKGFQATRDAATKGLVAAESTSCARAL